MELIFDMDEVTEDPWTFADDNGVRVLSHLDWLAGYADSRGLAAVLFTGISGDEYEFDIAVAPRARRQGLASKLMDLAIENYEDMLEPFPDLVFSLDVINPVSRRMLEQRGFKVVGGTPDRPLMSRNPVDLPQDTWVEAGPEELDQLESRSLWHVYEGSYNPVGLQYSSLEGLKEGLDVLWLVDVDGDPYIDAFIGYKRKRHGNKITVLATDGSKVAKTAMLSHLVALLQTEGWYAEMSHRPAEILMGRGVFPIDDEREVRRVLKGKNLTWLGDGAYERNIPGVGPAVKMLFGRPR